MSRARDNVDGAVGEEEEVTNGVLRQVQPQGGRHGDVVVDPWAALIIEETRTSGSAREMVELE